MSNTSSGLVRPRPSGPATPTGQRMRRAEVGEDLAMGKTVPPTPCASTTTRSGTSRLRQTARCYGVCLNIRRRMGTTKSETMTVITNAHTNVNTTRRAYRPMPFAMNTSNTSFFVTSPNQYAGSAVTAKLTGIATVHTNSCATCGRSRLDSTPAELGSLVVSTTARLASEACSNHENVQVASGSEDASR
jgi:hypothetical protein